MKKTIIITLSVLLTGTVTISLASRTGANPKIKKKVELIKSSLIQDGYDVKWIIISEKRSKAVNALLPNSAKNSQHLIGNAIDVYVFDINGDGEFNRTDIEIVKKHNRKIEKLHPELRGAFGTYTNTLTSRHTIHFDSRGWTVEYNK